MSSSARRMTKVHHVAPIIHAGQTFSKAAGPAGGRTPRAPSQARLLSSRDSSSSNMSSRRTSTVSNLSTTNNTATSANNTPKQASLQADHPTSPTEADYACEEFKSGFPCYEKTENHFANLRKSDFSRFDLGVTTSISSTTSTSEKKQHQPVPKVYLDNAGAAPHSETLVKEHFEQLTKALVTNPLTSSSCSASSAAVIEKARTDVLRYFKADPEEYDCIFTASATAALKIVGECYTFGSGEDSTFMLTNDNHESVVAIRDYAKNKGAKVEYLPVEPEDLRLCQKTVISAFSSHNNSSTTANASEESPSSSKLFAFPAQSNFSGVKHPLALIDMARSAGFDVLLDCAAYCPTSSLNLSISWMKPDFMTVSFYKMFGFPTGVGALIVKKATLAKRLLPGKNAGFFAGTCDSSFAPIKTEEDTTSKLLHHDHRAFEDGASFNFMNISAVSAGLEFIKNKCGGVENISGRAKCLTSYLLKTMMSMKHKKKSAAEGQDRKLIQVYGPEDDENRGATIPFNVLDVDGKVLNYKDIEVLAASSNIVLGAGLFSNPGACEGAFGWGKKKKTQDDDDENIVRGALRVSAGVATNFHDIYALITFLRTLEDLTTEEVSKKASIAALVTRH